MIRQAVEAVRSTATYIMPQELFLVSFEIINVAYT